MRKVVVILILGILLAGLSGTAEARKLSVGAYIKTAKIEILSGDLERYEYAIVMLDSLLLNYGPHAEAYYWLAQIMVDFLEKTPDLDKKAEYLKQLITYADSLRWTCDNKKVKKKYRKNCKKFSHKTDSTLTFYWRLFYNNGVDQLKEVQRLSGDIEAGVDEETERFYRKQMTALADSAVKNFTLAIAIDSADPQPYIGLSTLYAAQDSLPAATEWLKRGLDKVEDRRMLLRPIAYNYIEMNDYCGSIPYLREYVDLEPDSLLQVYHLTIAYNNCKMYDSAKVMHLRILAKDPNNVSSLMGIGDYFATRARMASDSARAYSEANDEEGRKQWLEERQRLADSAFAYYAKAFKVKPDDLDIVEKYGLFAFLDQNYEAAVEAYSKAVSIDPSRADNWKTLGDAYLSMKEFAKATEAYEKAAELTPDDLGLWQNLADLYIMTKQPEKRKMAEKRVEELQQQ